MSALDVKRLRHPGGQGNVLVAVGGVPGLALQLTPGGARTWILRAMVGKRRREIGLGGYPAVPLAQAREAARAARESIREGRDPVEQRKAARAELIASQSVMTFAEAVTGCLAGRTAGFRNAKHRDQWRSTLETYANPMIGGRPVRDVTVEDVERVLRPIWESKTETATRLRGRMEAVLAWATVKKHRAGDNPARWKGNLDVILPQPSHVSDSDNHPAVALGEASAWFEALRGRAGLAARALEFLALCASRSGEVRGAVWPEFDLAAGVWTIPAARMKGRAEHRVPLSAPALALVERQPRFPTTDLVFAAARGGMMSDMTLSAVMRRMQEAETVAGRRGWLDSRSARPAVPHGLRSTFRDWAAEHTEYPRDMAEIALAHKVGSEVERAYRRGDMMERRRAMMADWAAFLTTSTTCDVIACAGPCSRSCTAQLGRHSP